MARIKLIVEIELEVQTHEEAIEEVGRWRLDDGSERIWVLQHPEVYPIPKQVLKVTCEGKEIQDEHEDHMEHRYLLLGTGGDGYTLTVTHYIV